MPRRRYGYAYSEGYDVQVIAPGEPHVFEADGLTCRKVTGFEEEQRVHGGWLALGFGGMIVDVPPHSPMRRYGNRPVSRVGIRAERTDDGSRRAAMQRQRVRLASTV